MSKLSRALKKSQEQLHETYESPEGDQMVIIPDQMGHMVHVPVAFLVANKYVPNPLGSTDVGFKDGDRKNLNADNLIWLTKEEVAELKKEKNEHS